MALLTLDIMGTQLKTFIKLKAAKTVTADTASGKNTRYTSDSTSYYLNSSSILRVWNEVYPNNHANNDDHSAIIVEDVRGNIYIWKETNDCSTSESDLSEFLTNMKNH